MSHYGSSSCAILTCLVIFWLHSATATTASKRDEQLKAESERLKGAREHEVDIISIEYLAQRRGYRIEAHRIATRDGYILTIHRLINPLLSGRSVVIIQHGILCASPFFLLNSSPLDDLGHDNQIETSKGSQQSQHKTTNRTSNSLAIALSALGHDVWLTNLRGTQYSRDHLNGSLDDQSKYWNFNVDTLIEFDYEAYVSYILKKTGASKYTFVGHSLGATVGLGSLLVHQGTPLTERLACSILMAPVASTQYMQGSLLPLFQTATILYNDLSPFPGANKTFVAFARSLCLIAHRLCAWLSAMFLGTRQSVAGQTLGQIMEKSSNESMTKSLRLFSQPDGRHQVDLMEHQSQLNLLALMMRQSISIHVLKHIVQVHLSGRLSRYNYGPKLNLLKYGKRVAPTYELAKVRQPKLKLAIVSGPSDAISTFEEIDWIVQQLKGNVAKLEQIAVPLRRFNHMDLVMSQDAGELVNRPVIDFMRRNECL